MVHGDERELTTSRPRALPGGQDIAEEALGRLRRHLRNWLGDWRDVGAPLVVASPYRDRPGWDGQRRPFVGIVTPTSTVVSVSRHLFEPVREAVDGGGLDELGARLPAIVGRDGATLRQGIFRYQQLLVPHRERGIWLEPTNPIVPEWLHPFNGDVLVALDADGRYAAGVGRKRHDEYAQELAVVTEPEHRNRGYARDLVAQAATRVYEEGFVATYLHRPDNVGSAAVAESTGFFDRGWKILMLSFSAP